MTTIPHIKTVTIDHHDDKPPMKWRAILCDDGLLRILTRDYAPYIDLKADDDGDYRSTLEAFGVPFVEQKVDNLGEIIGPMTLVAEQDLQRLVQEAAKRLTAISA